MAGARRALSRQEGTARCGRTSLCVWPRVWTGTADGHDWRDRRAADRVVAVKCHEPQLPHGVSLDTFTGNDCRGEFLAAGARAAHRGKETTILPHGTARAARHVSPVSSRCRCVWLRRFFSHAADSLRHPHVNSHARNGSGREHRRRFVYAAQRLLCRLCVCQRMDQRSCPSP